MSIYPSSKVLPYVYQCVHKITGKIYIGSRVANNKPSHIDFQKYRTSSKYVRPVFDEFDWVIVAEFFDPKDAYNFEQQLIHEQWLISKEMSLNKRCDHGKKSWNVIGIKHSMNHKKNLSLIHYGEKHTKERNDNKSKLQTFLYDFLNPEGIVIKDISIHELSSLYNFVECTARRRFLSNKLYRGFQLIDISDLTPKWLIESRRKSASKLKNKDYKVDKNRNDKISDTLTKNYYDFLTPDGFVIENLSMKQLCSQFNLSYYHLAKTFAKSKSYRGFVRLWNINHLHHQ